MMSAGAAPPESETLSSRLRAALALVDEAIADARARLLDQPDNPRIQRFGTGAGRERAFTIQFSDMVQAGNRWDVFSHDWIAQYRYARELLDKRRFSALRELLSQQAYRDPSHGLRCFAPEVIDNIKRITGDLRDMVSLTDANRMADLSPDHAEAIKETNEPRPLRRRP